jgi:predicted Zn-dependent protease
VLRGDHNQAANYFNDAILLAPDDPAIMEDLARSQIACGKFGDAEFNLGRLLRMDENKDRRDLQVLRAKCLLTIDRPVEARTLVQQVTTSPEGQNDAEAWVLLGNAASVLKDRGNLRLAGARVNALAPNRFEGYFFKAQYHNIENQKTEALSLVEKAIERSGTNTSPFVLKATILQDLGQPEAAQQAMAAALERNPNDRVCQIFKATLDQHHSGTAVTGVSTENGDK